MSEDAHFEKGDPVEVMVESDSDAGFKIITWHSASVLKATEGTKGRVFVQFTNLASYENTHLRERVEFHRIRPIPPPARWWFKVGDKVEVLHEYGWRGGVVLEILEQSKYLVEVDGVVDGTEVDQWRVRMFREWVDGAWVPDEAAKQVKFSEGIATLKSAQIPEPVMKVTSFQKQEAAPRKVVVKFDGKEKTLLMQFDVGMRVEVSSDDAGYEGAYFAANIVKYLGDGKYLVEYLTLRTDDENELLREEAESRHIRPIPPYTLRIDRFKRFEVVDCWYYDGWWKGQVSRVLSRHKYVVYFNSPNEKLEFTHADLRIHQEWIDGQWIMASTSKDHSGSKSQV